MQSPKPRDQCVAGTKIEVIGVAEDDLRAQILEIAMSDPFDRPLRAHGHKGGRLDGAMRRAHLATPRRAVTGEEAE
jgi:hypothetical protein